MGKLYKENLLAKFGKSDSFTTKDVFNFYTSMCPEAKRSTVTWRVYELIKQGALQRIGRGVYTINLKTSFKIVPGKKEKSVSIAVKEKFPFISFCVWNTSLLQEFYHHTTNFNFLIVEVEREAVEAIFYYLKESYENTFREPAKTLIEDFIAGAKNVVIVKPLKSESPLQNVGGFFMPFLEKILVDLYADSDLFSFIQGNELLYIVKNAIEKYSINYDRLLRYAARRGKREEIKRMLNQINGNI
jgi:hypothetical protein